MSRSIIHVCTLIFFTFFNSCATTPETDRRQLMLVSEAQMKQMGTEAYSEVSQEYKESQNKELVQTIESIGKRLAKASGKDYDWQFKVFESDEINAFCLPGGKIAVFTGMFKVATTNAEIAAIMGHEIAHATARHGAERLSQALLAQGAMIAADISLRDSERRGLILGAMGMGVQFGVLLPYSRKHESEADHIGTIYMAEAGYDPEAALTVWKRMDQFSKNSPPEILSTHPHPRTRIQQLADQMPLYKEKWVRAQAIPTQKLPLGPEPVAE